MPRSKPTRKRKTIELGVLRDSRVSAKRNEDREDKCLYLVGYVWTYLGVAARPQLRCSRLFLVSESRICTSLYGAWRRRVERYQGEMGVRRMRGFLFAYLRSFRPPVFLVLSGIRNRVYATSLNENEYEGEKEYTWVSSTGPRWNPVRINDSDLERATPGALRVTKKK